MIQSIQSIQSIWPKSLLDHSHRARQCSNNAAASAVRGTSQGRLMSRVYRSMLIPRRVEEGAPANVNSVSFSYSVCCMSRPGTRGPKEHKRFALVSHVPGMA